jgi:plastocyanin
MRCARATALMVAIALLLAGCGDDPRSPGPQDLDRFTFDVGATLVVTERGFEPATVRVEAGKVIELRNDGDDEHTFTGDDGEFDITVLPGEQVTLIRKDAERITLHDTFDDAHTATIIVEAATSTTT